MADLVNMGELESGATEMAPISTSGAVPSTGLFSMDRPTYHPQPVETPVPKVQEPGFMPKFISVVAALKGNFGPLWDISEQTRKTEVFKALGTIVAQTDKRINQGDTEGALEYFNKAATQLGGRAPEIGQMIPGYLQRFNIIQDRMNAQKTAVAKLGVYAAEADARGDEILSKQYKRAEGALKKLTQTAPQTNEQLSEFLDRFGVKDIQADPHGNRIIRKTGLGTTDVTAMPQLFTEQDLGGKVAQDRFFSDPDLKAMLGGVSPTASNIINLMNLNNPAMHGIQSAIAQKINEARGFEQKLNIGAQVPLDPLAATGMLEKGASPTQVATREIAPGVVSAGAEAAATRQKAVQSATIEAQLEAPVSYSLPNATVVTNDPSNEFHGQADSGISLKNAISSKNKSVLPNTIYYGNIKPSFNALDGLGYVKDIFDPLRNPEGQYDKVSTGLARLISQQLGISLDPNLSKSKAAEAIAEQAINKVDELGTVSRKSVGDLRRYIAGAFADPEGAEKAVGVLRQRIEGELGRYMNQNKLSQDELRPRDLPAPQTVTIGKKGEVLDPSGKPIKGTEFLSPNQAKQLDEANRANPGLPPGTIVTPKGFRMVPKGQK